MSRRSLVPYLVLAVSLLLTAAATLGVARTAQARDRARFANAVQAATDRIGLRLDTYTALLRSGAGLFSASQEVSPEEFTTYVQRLDLERRYPGVQGIGYSARIPPEARDSVVAARRADGLPEFRLWPDPMPAEDVNAIVYLLPLDRRNRAALGFDMSSEPTRRAAMARARDSGVATASGRVTLVQEIEGRRQAGFLLYVPVYRGGIVPATVEERRERLRGFVYAPFRADDLFSGIFGSEERPRVAFRIYDGREVRPDRLLHDSETHGLRSAADPEFTSVGTLRVAGREWTAVFHSSDAFEAASREPLVPLFGGTGLVVSLLLFALTHAQVRAWKNAEEAREEAEAANRAKMEFLSAMSHELRTPLNAIGGYTELLEMGIHGPIAEAQGEALRRIRRSQHHLLALINDILNYARLEAGRVEFALSRVPMARLLHDLRDLTEPQVLERGLRADFHTCGPEITALADEEKVQQILLNLYTNAIKFTDAGGRVGVRCTAERDRVVVQVQDTGRGIPPDRLHSIFDPFVQVDRHRTEGSRQGVGLGLAISSDLARRMGGELSVQSEAGVGSTFTLTLPRAPDGAAPPPAPAGPSGGP